MSAQSPVLPPKYIITVGRTFGSGGRLVGQAIADKLNIGFYDKKLLVKAAEKSGLNHEYARENDERMPRMFGGIIPFSMGYYPSGWFGGTPSTGPDSIYNAQCDFIRELAQSEPCVIVGRSADYILRDLPNVVNIFVHAPAEACARRIFERGDASSLQEAFTVAERSNKLRANFYNFYTDKRWGAACSYDLCIDSTSLPMDQLADHIIDFVARKLANKA